MSLVINGIKVEDDTKLVYKSNPKRKGFMAYDRYEVYSFAQTLAEYLDMSESKYAKADLRFDNEKGYLEFVLSDTDDTE